MGFNRERKKGYLNLPGSTGRVPDDLHDESREM